MKSKTRSRRTLRKILQRIAAPTVVAATTALTFTLVSPPANADPSCPNNDPKYGYCVGGKILEEFNQAGGFNFFGNAVHGEADASRNGRWQPFVNGSSIYWHALVSGGHANQIGGLIRAKWGEMGWEDGDLRYPTTRELPTSAWKPGRFNHFEGGSIYWSQNTGAQPIWGAIRDHWAGRGWETSPLGFPKAPEFVTAGNGRGQEFEGGWIYWRSDVGASTVLRPIMDVWGANNWENGTYGYPVENTRGPGCGRYAQRFQNGMIVTNPDPLFLGYSSVDGSEIAFSANWTKTTSTTAWNAAVTEWNKLGKINIKPSGAFGYDVTANEVNLPEESYAGQYTYRPVLPDQIVLNVAFTDAYSASRRQATLVHELGHALGLEHSCSTQIMGPGDVRDQTLNSPQDLDKDLYRYKWGY